LFDDDEEEEQQQQQEQEDDGGRTVLEKESEVKWELSWMAHAPVGAKKGNKKVNHEVIITKVKDLARFIISCRYMV
jgi:hypothetical protein